MRSKRKKNESKVHIYPKDKLWLEKEKRINGMPIKKMISKLINKEKIKRRTKHNWEMGDYQIRV